MGNHVVYVMTVQPGHGNTTLESEIGLNLQVGPSVTRSQTVQREVTWEVIVVIQAKESKFPCGNYIYT